MTQKKNMLKNIVAIMAMLVLFVPSVFIFHTAAAYNPLTKADENLSNLEKARVILQHFQKSGVDSDWAYDVKANKEVVEIMLKACVEMTDEEVSQLTEEEEQSFYAYFQKLYEISGMDATELGELFEIKGLEKAVDEIYHVEDKKAEGALSQGPPSKGIITSTNKKNFVIVAVIIAAFALLAVALSKTIERVNRK